MPGYFARAAVDEVWRALRISIFHIVSRASRFIRQGGGDAGFPVSCTG
jgi:hypothetical protein